MLEREFTDQQLRAYNGETRLPQVYRLCGDCLRCDGLPQVAARHA